MSEATSVSVDSHQDKLKRLLAYCILPINTSIHDLQRLQENSFIIDGDTKAHDWGRGLQQDRRCFPKLLQQ